MKRMLAALFLVTVACGSTHGDPTSTSTAEAVGAQPDNALAVGTCSASEVAGATVVIGGKATHYWTCDPSDRHGRIRYMCDDDKNKIEEVCPSDSYCVSAGQGVDDYCAGASNNGKHDAKCSAQDFAAQNDPAYDNASIWTCQGATRFVCDTWNNKIIESCPDGCNSSAAGSDDQCAPPAGGSLGGGLGGGPQCGHGQYGSCPGSDSCCNVLFVGFTCVDTNTDPSNCGDCNNVCVGDGTNNTGAACLYGSCSL